MHELNFSLEKKKSAGNESSNLPQKILVGEERATRRQSQDGIHEPNVFKKQQQINAMSKSGFEPRYVCVPGERITAMPRPAQH